MNKRIVATFLVLMWNVALFMFVALGAVMLFLLGFQVPALTSLILLSVAFTSFVGVAAIMLLDVYVYTHGLDGVVEVFVTRRRGQRDERRV